MYPKDYIVLDSETTGLEHESCEIIEIGILLIQNNKIVNAAANELANPGYPLPQKIVEITHITDEMLKGKRTPLEVMADTAAILDKLNLPIVGHNIVNFDRLFLNKYYDKLGLKQRPFNMYIDTASLYKELRGCHVAGHSKYNVPKDPLAAAGWTQKLLEFREYSENRVKYNLTSAVNYLAVPQFDLDKWSVNRHRALYDCVLTYKVFEALKIEMKL